jgi:hypothetical protein
MTNFKEKLEKLCIYLIRECPNYFTLILFGLIILIAFFKLKKNNT